MTTKQSAAAASGLQTDYYHHEDKPMEQDVCVRVGVCAGVQNKPVGNVCLCIV